MGSGEKPSASEGRTNLEGKTPIYSIDGTLSSANDGACIATDGRAISFTYQQGGALTDEAINDGWTDGNVSVAIDGTRGLRAYRSDYVDVRLQRFRSC